MVDIVHVSVTEVKMHNIVDRSHNILNGYMDRHKLMVSFLHGCLKGVNALKRVKYFAHNGIVYFFLYADVRGCYSVLSDIRIHGNGSV